MNGFLEKLALRRRFGMRPGLDSIRALTAALGNPQDRFKAIHIAGTNGKGAVSALMSAALSATGAGRVGMYTSPHLVKLNERFMIDGRPVDDEKLDRYAQLIHAAITSCAWGQAPENITFFEALTAVSFLLFADAGVEFAVLECGLGGRLDATNICSPEICVITKIGLDHCDWLGNTIEEIAAEKAGIIKPGVPVVLGANDECVRSVISAAARSRRAPFFYASDLADPAEFAHSIPLSGSFNRDNAVTALAALRVLERAGRIRAVEPSSCFAAARWPGRFHRVGDFLVDGAHNPPAASALAKALDAEFPGRRFALIAGFCGDKDADAVLQTLAPLVSRGYAVKTNNPRSLCAEETARAMRSAGICAEACGSLKEAMSRSREESCSDTPTLVCGSLFLAGEALVALGELRSGGSQAVDPSELLSPAAPHRPK